MKKLQDFTFWFVTGSQDLYGQDVLDTAYEHAQQMVAAFNEDDRLPCPVVLKPVVLEPNGIRKVCAEANLDDSCAGVITWMHTFSPAKMWIGGLMELKKPLLHLHTQFNRDIPWDSIDMDFMNLNQSAHGDREYGFIGARLRMPRKIVAGYWQDDAVCERMGKFMRVAAAVAAGRTLKMVRFGDTMREVAVTEGDKVEIQIKLGWDICGYGIGDLVAYVDRVTEQEVDALMDEYAQLYDIDPAADVAAIREQAKYEIALERFCKDGDFSAFTTNFNILHQMKQLPGLASQRMMYKGIGFGGEGDWKVAVLVTLAKLMAQGIDQGTSFMEDYTYNLDPENQAILVAHMLEVDPAIAADKPRIEVHPLSIGDREDPARLVFNGKSGKATVACLVDMGGRFRLIVQEVTCKTPERAMPKLPVARVLWTPEPNLITGAEAWIMAGGAHHTVMSYSVDAQMWRDFAELTGMECVVIDEKTELNALANELRWNDLYWNLHK